MSFQADSGINYEIFRECLSGVLVQKSKSKPTKLAKKKAQKAKRDAKRSDTKEITPESVVAESTDPEELAEFIDFIASETFISLPYEIQSLSFARIRQDEALAAKYRDPLSKTLLDQITATLPVSISESLSVYGIVPEITDLPELLGPILSDYVSSVTAGPPQWIQTRTSACEICGRDWIPLSYHHLIPREVHAKVLKRGWHEEWMLNSAAWLCRACHSFVHKIASNEELARYYFTVERLLEREDIQDWARWAGRVRWRAR